MDAYKPTLTKNIFNIFKTKRATVVSFEPYNVYKSIIIQQKNFSTSVLPVFINTY